MDKQKTELAQLCKDKASNFNSLITMVFSCMIKELACRVDNPMIKSDQLTKQDREALEELMQFPPTKKDFEIVEQAMEKLGSGPTFVRVGTDYGDGLEKFLLDGAERLRKIDVKNSTCYMDIIEACQFMRDAYFILGVSKYEMSDMILRIRKMEELAFCVIGKAYEAIGYQTGKMERFKATKPATKGKREKMMEAIEKLVQKVKERGEKTENGIRISRKAIENIYQDDIEIYSDPTKRKYKKKAEEILGKKIIIEKH